MATHVKKFQQLSVANDEPLVEITQPSRKIELGLSRVETTIASIDRLSAKNNVSL